MSEESGEGLRARRVTVELAAYVGVGLLAGALRFFQVGQRPLAEGEATQALAAFRFVHGAAQTGPSEALPALFTGNVASFSLLGGGDLSARWLPIVAGLCLALLPYGLRHRLGRGGALVASLLLALSPTAVYMSRMLDGAILVAACGLGLAVASIRYLDTRRPGWLYAGAAALGLGLCSGPGIYTLVLLFALFGAGLFLVERALGRKGGWSSLLVAWWASRGEKGLLARVGAVLAATFGLVAMTFMLHPAGVGDAADLLAAWVKGFAPERGGQPAIYPLLLLLRYELLVLVFGLVEVGRYLFGSARERGLGSPDPARAGTWGSAFPHTAFLGFWTVGALAAVVGAGHRPAGNLLLVVVPLALLAGQGIERGWQWLAARCSWKEAGMIAAVAVALGIFFYLQMATYTLIAPGATIPFLGRTLYATNASLLLALVAVLLLLGLAAVAWIWRGSQAVVAGGWLALLIGLGLVGIKGTWNVGVDHAADARELMVGQTTPVEVRGFSALVARLSLDEAGDVGLLPLTVDAATGPVVAWYLRDYERQTVVDGVSSAPGTAAVVTLGQQDLPLGESFRGQRFPLRTHWMPWGLGWQKLVRWLLFTEGSEPVVDREVVLWVEP